MSYLGFGFSLIFYFMLWTLCSYWIHRIAHIPHKKNILFKVHQAHHMVQYGESYMPSWGSFFFWFGSWKASLDVWISLTLPVVIIAIIDPVPGITLLIFHYVYEVFFSSNVLDHNPKIKGMVTRIFAIGQYHLQHHRVQRWNYSFFITLWDHVFRTVKKSGKNTENRAVGGSL